MEWPGDKPTKNISGLRDTSQDVLPTGFVAFESDIVHYFISFNFVQNNLYSKIKVA